MTDERQQSSADDFCETVAAGCMPPWHVADLPPPPVRERKSIFSILGPGILLAGGAIGAGEWLFGPAVTAQYGGTLLWLATISILVQVVYNIEVMRYALYCGEPVFIGYFRTPPGPRIWTACYIVLFIGNIWPFMASNAAVPLAAAVLGHLPGERVMTILGLAVHESSLVKILGFAIFFAAFVPLVFGGKVYTMLERVMTSKLVIVLGFLVIVVATLVSWSNIGEILTGFVRFGSVALRAETIVAGPHFSITERKGDTTYVLQGSIEHDAAAVTAFIVGQGRDKRQYTGVEDLTSELQRIRREMIAEAEEMAKPSRFYVESVDPLHRIILSGAIAADGAWQMENAVIVDKTGRHEYASLDEIPKAVHFEAQSLIANRGFIRESLWNYWRDHGRLPDLDWGMLAAFAAIAGSGGLTNCLLSNYARDKGWGMGAQTGAIPSAVGGRQIALSHVGKVFPVTPENLKRWRGWFHYIVRDQAGVWMTCCFVGLALPCMLSLQFIRNVPVSGNRVAALTAEGISSYFPSHAAFWWTITLCVSFLALAPNAVMTGDLIARMWTDLLWVGNRRAQRMEEHQVKYLYYGILALYAVWGCFALAVLNPLEIAKLGAVLGNISLGFSAFHTLYVNRTLLPPELRPNHFMQAGLVATGVFFLTITLVAALTM